MKMGHVVCSHNLSVCLLCVSFVVSMCVYVCLMTVSQPECYEQFCECFWGYLVCLLWNVYVGFTSHVSQIIFEPQFDLVKRISCEKLRLTARVSSAHLRKLLNQPSTKFNVDESCLSTYQPRRITLRDRVTLANVISWRNNIGGQYGENRIYFWNVQRM